MSGRDWGYELREAGKNGLFHIARVYEEDALCNKTVPKKVPAGYRAITGVRHSHFHGRKMVESVLCKTCLSQAKKILRSKISWGGYEDIKEVLYPIKAIRPLPGKKQLQPITRMLYNARERLRRESLDWFGRPTITQSNQSYKKQAETAVVVWDYSMHHAFNLGVNYAIDEVLKDFKLQKYDEWRDKAYTELHEFVTGEKPAEIPEED